MTKVLILQMKSSAVAYI